MNYLLFFISIIFSFIFYLFHLSNTGGTLLGQSFSKNTSFDLLSGNLLVETTIFLLIAIFFFLGFSSYEKRAKAKKIDIAQLKIFIYDFFKKYLYYIGFLFTYTGLFFILKSYSFFSINIFILFISIIVFVLFFISNKFFIFRDFIKVNTILFSLFYIFFYIYSFFTKNISFIFIDFLNSILIISFFILNFYNDKKILNKKNDNTLIFYFFIYIYIFISYYSSSIFINIYFDLSVIGVILSSILYYFITKLKLFSGNIILLRYISFLFIYIATFSSILFILKNDFNLIMFGILLYSGYFNFKIHKKFENYISLSFSLLIPIFLIFYFYFKILFSIDDGFIFLVLSLGVSVELIILTYFYKFKYSFDNYFIHSVSYLINIVTLIYYFTVFEFDFFIMGVILFFEALIAFSSYYKLKQTKLILKK